MTGHTYTVLLHPNEPDERPGYWLEVPALPGCFSRGNSLEHALAMAEDAILCYLGALMDDGEAIPSDITEFEVPRGGIVKSVTVDLAEVMDGHSPVRATGSPTA